MMRRLTGRISPTAHLAASIVLVAFAALGITNASHDAAKIVYGILIVLGLALVTTGILRRQHERGRD